MRTEFRLRKSGRRRNSVGVTRTLVPSSYSFCDSDGWQLRRCDVVLPTHPLASSVENMEEERISIAPFRYWLRETRTRIWTKVVRGDGAARRRRQWRRPSPFFFPPLCFLKKYCDHLFLKKRTKVHKPLRFSSLRMLLDSAVFSVPFRIRFNLISAKVDCRRLSLTRQKRRNN